MKTKSHASTKPNKIEMLRQLARVAGAIERRGNTRWTVRELQADTGTGWSTINRYLAEFREHLGLVTEATMGGPDKGLQVVGKWSFVEQVKRLMK